MPTPLNDSLTNEPAIIDKRQGWHKKPNPKKKKNNQKNKQKKTSYKTPKKKDHSVFFFFFNKFPTPSRWIFQVFL